MRKFICTLNNTGSGSQPIQVQAGHHMFMFVFSWPENETDEYNQWQERLSIRSASDPLIKDGDILRDYDYIEYYMNLPDELPPDYPLPKSLKNMTPEEREQEIQVRKEEVVALNTMLNEYRQLMSWNFSYTVEGVTKTGMLKIGGWYKEDLYRFRFVSDKEEIGPQDLDKVTVEFEVYE